MYINAKSICVRECKDFGTSIKQITFYLTSVSSMPFSDMFHYEHLERELPL